MSERRDNVADGIKRLNARFGEVEQAINRMADKLGVEGVARDEAADVAAEGEQGDGGE